MRLMYDSVTAKDIPRGATMVAGYINGKFKWSEADWKLFPLAVKVRIATRENVLDGHVLDVEVGAATINGAPSWVKARRAAGIDPTVYCSLSVWEMVQAAFRAQNVPQPHYWIAQYNGRAVPISGAIAHQYINPPASGGHYDISIVANYWPGIDGNDDMPTLDEIELMIKQKILAGEWRFDGTTTQAGRNPIDMARQTLSNTFGLGTAVTSARADVARVADDILNLRDELASVKALLTDLLNDGVRLTANGEIVVKAE